MSKPKLVEVVQSLEELEETMVIEQELRRLLDGLELKELPNHFIYAFLVAQNQSLSSLCLVRR